MKPVTEVHSCKWRGRRNSLWMVCLCLSGYVFTLGTVSAGGDQTKPAPPAASKPASVSEQQAVERRQLDPEPSSKDRSHWAFQPVRRLAPPQLTQSAEWVRTPVDNFVLARLQKAKVAPATEAEPRAWLRRVYFDLIGLPPSQAEVLAFERDSSQSARERIVERLLADPGYGIRWGRHWLDVVRYADTNGYERDGDKPHVWRYRDWVIEALNQDLPFDQFVTWQLAGDEVDEPNARTMVAATFLRLGTWDDEPADPLVDRYDQLDDIVKSVSATFLGLTMSCARCHNHKFEPLSQTDYAGMLAMFEPLKRPQNFRTDLDVPIGTPQETAIFEQTQSRYEAAKQGLDKQLQDLRQHVRTRFLNTGKTSLPPEAWQAHKVEPKFRNDAQKKLVQETQAKFDQELAQSRSASEQRQLQSFEEALASLQKGIPPQLPRGYVWKEGGDAVPVSHVFRRGNPASPAFPVEPHVPRVLDALPWTPLPQHPTVKSTRRRLSLARWLTDARHPLTSRVIVNRIWQGHFGEGIVRSENDFGVMGSSPTHPELLDWLAAYLQDRRWSLKELHRVIVLSHTYAQASQSRGDQLAKQDPENEWLARFPYRRLEAEQIRDALLNATGTLNRQMGGPGVFPPMPAEVLAGQSKPGWGWQKSDPAQVSRRSIYIHVKRSLLVPMFELMDLPDTTAPCEQRNVSTIPTQALTMLNSDFMNDEADRLAVRMSRDGGGTLDQQVTQAYWWALSRAPSAEEVRLARDFVGSQRTKLEQELASKGTPVDDKQRTVAQTRALQAFCLVLLNLNEFVYLD